MDMDIRGLPWKSTEIRGWPWKSIDIHGWPRICTRLGISLRAVVKFCVEVQLPGSSMSQATPLVLEGTGSAVSDPFI